jgi:hypothetical protein
LVNATNLKGEVMGLLFGPVQMKRFLTLFAALALLLLVPYAVAASATLFGGATIQGKQVKLVSDTSDASTTNDASGVNFTDTGVTTFSTLMQLSTKFNVTDDDCGGGSPRFQINFGTQNVFVYLGPSPTFTGCAKNTLLASGNLIGNNDACRWDTSQILAGTQCNTYAGALALLGPRTVTGIQLVVDSSWFFADKEQTVLACDVRINKNRFFFPCQGKGQGAPGAGGGNKITICHHTNHKSTGETKHVTIRISQSAWPAHQKHGDTMGACNSPANLRAHSTKAHVKKFHAKLKKSGR